MNLGVLAPELIVFITAIVVILLDLAIKRKGILAAVSIAGLLVAILFSAALWGTRGVVFNRMLVIDEFAIFFKVLFAAAAILVILASTDYVSKFQRFQGEYYGLILLSVVGMTLMAATAELISIYISLELASISLYVLAAFLKDEKSSEAGLKYLLLGAIASAVLLYGMALIFGLTGSTHLTDIAAAVRTHGASPVLLLGIIFMVAGFGFKIASVPFQMWVPDVYEGAPTPVTAYLSVASKAAGFAVIVRVFWHGFGPAVAGWLALDWGLLFAVLSAVSMTVGNLAALSQTNIKRMLGYSSIAQAGYIMVGLAAIGFGPATDPYARSGVLFFLASYTLTNLGAFIAIIAITKETGSDLIEDFAGAARRAPWLALGLAFCLISLTGIPPTAGFLAKFYIFNAGVSNNLAWLVLIGVINSVIAAYYYLRVVKMVYLGAPKSERPIPSSGPLRLAMSLACLGVLFIGIIPAYVLKAAVDAINLFTR
ncbi:MAG: NADH-quinone oxidoreductase subunit N [Chloroflexi bacterium]|nr:NADH-quinone oxidoreductase subunit N [Chloroflexota bacterium]